MSRTSQLSWAASDRQARPAHGHDLARDTTLIGAGIVGPSLAHFDVSPLTREEKKR